jgi:hypothetical protein
MRLLAEIDAMYFDVAWIEDQPLVHCSAESMRCGIPESLRENIIALNYPILRRIVLRRCGYFVRVALNRSRV